MAARKKHPSLDIVSSHGVELAGKKSISKYRVMSFKPERIYSDLRRVFSVCGPKGKVDLLSAQKNGAIGVGQERCRPGREVAGKIYLQHYAQGKKDF